MADHLRDTIRVTVALPRPSSSSAAAADSLSLNTNKLPLLTSRTSSMRLLPIRDFLNLRTSNSSINNRATLLPQCTTPRQALLLLRISVLLSIKVVSSSRTCSP